MKHLFTPLSIKSVTLRNRIVMAPMCMYSADAFGFVQPFHLTHYAARAMGGTALVLLEATAVEPRGRISRNDLGIWDDAHIVGLKQIVDEIHRYGAKAGIQLAHAGRKCNVHSENSIAPSPISFDSEDPEFKMPLEMNPVDILTVTSAFKEAARRAEAAGFDVIELHGAHGYLINEFLSPLSNKRTDDYGYTFEYGTKFLKEILDQVGESWPKMKPIFLRVTSDDYAEGGNTPLKLSKALNLIQGVDVIDVSSGGVVPTRVASYDGYQTKYAEIIKSQTDFMILSGGRIRSSQMADELIRNDRADLVFIGRQLLIDPNFVMHAAVELRQDIDYSPVQYERWKTSRA